MSSEKLASCPFHVIVSVDLASRFGEICSTLKAQGTNAHDPRKLGFLQHAQKTRKHSPCELLSWFSPSLHPLRPPVRVPDPINVLQFDTVRVQHLACKFHCCLVVVVVVVL